MNPTASKSPYKFSKLNYLRLGLIIGGSWFISAHQTVPMQVPAVEVQTEPVRVQTPCGPNFYCRYMDAGDAHTAARKYSLAEKDYAAALLETKKFNAANFCLIDTMQSLGHTYMHEGKYKQAVAIFEKIENLSEKTLVAHDVRITESMLDLAVSYAANKEPDKAEAYLKRIVAIWESAPAGWEVNLCISKTNLQSFHFSRNMIQLDNATPFQYSEHSFAPPLNR